MNKEKLREYKRKWQKNWRKHNPSAARLLYKKYGKVYKERHPEKVKVQVKNAVKKWRLNNPQKNQAQRKVFVAVRNGTLLKQACFYCDDPKTQAHHPDYSKPLEVIWVCKIHHSLEDKKRRNQQFIHNLT